MLTRELLDRYHDMIRATPRDWRREDALAATIEEEMVRTAPAEMKSLFQKHEAFQAIFSDEAERNARYHGYLRPDARLEGLRTARDESWALYDGAMTRWFGTAFGRPMHDYEVGWFMVVWRCGARQRKMLTTPDPLATVFRPHEAAEAAGGHLGEMLSQRMGR